MSGEATRTARELEQLLAACFRWIDSTAFATPRVIGALAGAINEIRYTDHERTPAEIVAAALEAAGAEGAQRGSWDPHLENAVNMLNGEVARLESERDALAVRVRALETALVGWILDGPCRSHRARVRELEDALSKLSKYAVHHYLDEIDGPDPLPCWCDHGTDTEFIARGEHCPECSAARAALAAAPAERAGE